MQCHIINRASHRPIQDPFHSCTIIQYKIVCREQFERAFVRLKMVNVRKSEQNGTNVYYDLG